jgi:hypothetical protein
MKLHPEIPYTAEVGQGNQVPPLWPEEVWCRFCLCVSHGGVLVHVIGAAVNRCVCC